MIQRIREWLAAVLARWSGRLGGPKLKPFVPPLVTIDNSVQRPPRYTVARWLDGKHWTIYEGPNGGDARRAYEQVIQNNEMGRMEFWMNTEPGKLVVRGSYERVS